MKTASLLVLVIASLAFANSEEVKNVKTQLKEDWRSELLEGDCSQLSHYDNLVSKQIKWPVGSTTQEDELQYSGQKIVKCIVVTNSMDASEAGQVAIVGGGIGQHTTELKFRALATRGMDFQVDIWGTV